MLLWLCDLHSDAGFDREQDKTRKGWAGGVRQRVVHCIRRCAEEPSAITDKANQHNNTHTHGTFLCKYKIVHWCEREWDGTTWCYREHTASLFNTSKTVKGWGKAAAFQLWRMTTLPSSAGVRYNIEHHRWLHPSHIFKITSGFSI